MRLRPASLAMAFAINDLPTPEGPKKNINLAFLNHNFHIPRYVAAVF